MYLVNDELDLCFTNHSHYFYGTLAKEKNLITIECKNSKCTLSVNYQNKDSIEEVNIDVYLDEAEALLLACETKIEKIKHNITDEFGQTWTVYEYIGDNKGIVLATSKEEINQLPDWIEREVDKTEIEYKEFNLLKNPYKNWKDK